MEKSKNLKSLPIIVSIFQLMIYLAPFLTFDYISIFIGLFTREEMNSVVNRIVPAIIFLATAGAGVYFSIFIRKSVKDYANDKISQEEFNKRTKLVTILNIAIPILGGVLYGVDITIVLAVRDIAVSSFMGGNPTFTIVMFAFSNVCNFSLLFYVLYIKAF